MKLKLAALLALLTLGLAACGDSPETKAVKAINKAQDDTGALVLAHAGDINGSSSQAEAARGINGQAASLDALADRINNTKVPDKADAQRDALVSEMHSAARLVRGWKSDPTFHDDIKAAESRVKATTVAFNREMGR